jgi:hypothetical protein
MVLELYCKMAGGKRERPAMNTWREEEREREKEG